MELGDFMDQQVTINHKQFFRLRELGFLIIASSMVAIYLGVALLYIQKPVLAIERPSTPKEHLYEQCALAEHDCDAVLLDAIASCESQWRMVPNAGSSAYGYYQILDSTERTTPQYKAGERKYNPYTNVDMAIYLFDTRGSNPWNESKGCWSWKYELYLSDNVLPCVGVGCYQKD